MGLSISAEWIFKKQFISKFQGRLVNLHGSRLPKMCGGGGISWVIMQNNRHAGATIHLINPGIDTGKIVASREYFFPVHCRKPIDYQNVAYKENSFLLMELIADIEAGKEFEFVSQQGHLGTYWPRLSTEHHGFINWNWQLEDIKCFICAFDEPYKRASTFVNGQRIYIKDCAVDVSDGNYHPFQTGLIYKKSIASLAWFRIPES